MFPFLSSGTYLKCTPAQLPKKKDMGAPITEEEKAELTPFAVCGVAWDGCVTNRPGARFGPKGIREASHMLCDGIHPEFNTTPHDIFAKMNGSGPSLLVDYGDLRLPNTSLVAMREQMEAPVTELINRHHMLWLGGDHSITLGLLRAYHKARGGKPLAIIHFDAHCDTWEDHFGEPSGHGTWVYEAIEEGICKPETFIQIGIRSSGHKEAREYVQTKGGIIFTGKQMRGVDGPILKEKVTDVIKERLAAHGNPDVYITFDIDCLDPAFAPGTGTPEVGGLTSNQALSILEELHDLPCIGMDIVEVAPAFDHAELTTNAAATLSWTYLCGQVARLGLQKRPE